VFLPAWFSFGLLKICHNWNGKVYRASNFRRNLAECNGFEYYFCRLLRLGLFAKLWFVPANGSFGHPSGGGLGKPETSRLGLEIGVFNHQENSGLLFMFNFLQQKPLSDYNPKLSRQELIRRSRILVIDDEKPKLIDDLGVDGFSVDYDSTGDDTSKIEKTFMI
jgi:hypothetical protein